MALSDDARRILDDFESTPSDKIVAVLEGIKTNMKSEPVREYLAGKIAAVRSAAGEEEKKGLCRGLKPYLDWEIQGG